MWHWQRDDCASSARVANLHRGFVRYWTRERMSVAGHRRPPKQAGITSSGPCVHLLSGLSRIYKKKMMMV